MAEERRSQRQDRCLVLGPQAHHDSDRAARPVERCDAHQERIQGGLSPYLGRCMLLLILTLVSAGAFLYFGFEALFADRVRQEFERYGCLLYTSVARTGSGQARHVPVVDELDAVSYTHLDVYKRQPCP